MLVIVIHMFIIGMKSQMLGMKHRMFEEPDIPDEEPDDRGRESDLSDRAFESDAHVPDQDPVVDLEAKSIARYYNLPK